MTQSVEITYKGRGVFVPAINIQEYLLNMIRENQAITRDEMMKKSGIPRTTIYDAMVKLLLDGKVRKYSVPSKKRGRPRVFYEVVA